MSKIGRKPIPIPAGVEVKVSQQDKENLVLVKGAKGEQKRTIPAAFDIKVEQGFVKVSPKEKKDRIEKAAFWGLYRALIANMIKGVSEGFSKRLVLEGIGYRATLEGGKKLILSLGFSHPVEFSAPEGIEFKVEKNIITVSGQDKEQVGQAAAQLRDLKPPEPYKGKGIHYEDEVVRRKAGKKAVTTV